MKAGDWHTRSEEVAILITKHIALLCVAVCAMRVYVIYMCVFVYVVYMCARTCLCVYVVYMCVCRKAEE